MGLVFVADGLGNQWARMIVPSNDVMSVSAGLAASAAAAFGAAPRAVVQPGRTNFAGVPAAARVVDDAASVFDPVEPEHASTTPTTNTRSTSAERTSIQSHARTPIATRPIPDGSDPHTRACRSRQLRDGSNDKRGGGQLGYSVPSTQTVVFVPMLAAGMML